MDFENKLTHNGIHYSRYIASWTKVCRKSDRNKTVYFEAKFCGWLISEGLTEEEIRDICRLANNGKLELEESAKRFLMTN